MNDPQGNAAADTAQTSAPAQPAMQPQIDDGYERVPREQYQTLMRNNERVRGFEQHTPVLKAISNNGWKLEDIQTYGEFAKFAKENGLDPKGFMQSFKRETTEQQPGSSPLDIEAIKKELAGGFVSKDELALERATGKHEMAQERQNTVVQKAIESLAGELPFPKAVVSRAVAGFLSDPQNYRLYPDGHPLHDRTPMPHDEDSLKPIIAAIKKELSEAAGESLAATGDAVLKGKVPSPAGSSPEKPTKTTKDDETRPGGLPSRATLEAAAKAKAARRGNAPVSSVGG